MGSAASTQAAQPPTAEQLAHLRAAWPPGSLCIIGGLQSGVGQQLNGRLAEVRELDEKSGRLCLRLNPEHDQGQWKKIRHVNVHQATLVLPSSDDGVPECRFCMDTRDEALVSPCQCRGSAGAVHLGCIQQAYKSLQRFDYPTCPSCKERYESSVAAMLLEGARESLDKIFEIGMPVQLVGLTGNPVLNGQEGLLKSYDINTGRWQVIMRDSIDIKAVRPENLLPPTLDENHRVKRLNVMRCLGIAYSSANQPSKAAHFMEKAVSLEEHQFGKEDLDLAAPLTNLGIIYIQLKELDKAMGVLQRALAIKERNLGEDHYDIAATLSSLGHVRQMSGDFEGARRDLERALELTEGHHGSQHNDLVPSLTLLGNVCREQGEAQKGAGYLERSLAIQERSVGKHHISLASTLNDLSKAYEAAGDGPTALVAIERALAITERELGPKHSALIPLLQRLQEFYTAQGSEADAANAAARAATLLGNMLHSGTLPNLFAGS